MKAYLFRNYEEHQTTGRFILTENEDLLFKSYSLELPDLNNKPYFSCIPTGDYVCKIERSPKYGPVFHIKDVPGRSHILIHPGNYNKNTKGCLLLGENLTDINGDGERS